MFDQPFNMGRVPPVTFGPGTLAKVPRIAAGLGSGPVLVVADAVLAQLGVTDQLSAHFAKAGMTVEVAAEISGEPKDALVDRLAARARDTGCKVVVGLGGGAAMDAAKLVAAVACADKPALHYALCANPYPAERLPAIAVPTTAGTGSEVTRTSIVSTAEGLKYWYWGEELMFAHAVLDPELSVSLPPHITAWTGMDAVAHALEAVTSRSSNPAGQAYGFQALGMLADALPRAVAEGSDVALRGKMIWAATVAGLALHNCNTHMGHNISHSLGSLAPVHHGLATGLGLEVSLPFLCAQPAGEANYARASAALGGEAEARALPATFIRLMRDCGIDGRLPAACAHVTPEALLEQMRSDANIGMSLNAACDLSEVDLEEMAMGMMALPGEEIAA
ncbi:MAG: iron-containing alcohol dehydrogenase [Pseudomonadota bacterium]